jgi:hypothetical protein
MAQISGIPVENITAMRGVDATSVLSIGGISTSNIPGWPTRVSCIIVYYGYAPSRPGTAPEESCTADQFAYEWDMETGTLYNEGGCGTGIARLGYYSDGTTIYFCDGEGILSEYGSCNPYPTFSNLTNIVNPNPSYRTLSFQYSSQQNGATAMYRFVTGGGVSLYCKVSLSSEYPYNGDYDVTSPKNLLPQFLIAQSITSEFSVNSGEYISLGFDSDNFPPGNPIIVTVESKLEGTTTWNVVGSFVCSNTV